MCFNKKNEERWFIYFTSKDIEYLPGRKVLWSTDAEISLLVLTF